MVSRFFDRRDPRQITPAHQILQQRRPQPAPMRGPVNRGPTPVSRPVNRGPMVPNRPSGGMTAIDLIRQRMGNPMSHQVGMSPAPQPDVMGRIRDVVRPAIGGLASGVGSALAKAAIPDVDSLVAQAQQRAAQRTNAISQLSGLSQPISRQTNPLPSQSRTPSINPIYRPDTAAPPIAPASLKPQISFPALGQPGALGIQYNTGAMENAAKNGGSLTPQVTFPALGQPNPLGVNPPPIERFSNRGPLTVPPPWDSGVNGAVPPGSVGTQHGMPAYPVQGPVPMNVDISPAGAPTSPSTSNPASRTGPGPAPVGLPQTSQTIPLGTAPQLPGVLGVQPGGSIPLNTPLQPGVLGIQYPGQPGPGAYPPGQGPGGGAGQPAPPSPGTSPTPGSSAPPPTSPGSSSVAIPDPRAGLPRPAAASPGSPAPSVRPPTPVPPWVWQQQPVQIPANIYAGNPNLRNLAPGGQVDTSAAMGPIWGPIAQGQLPGGLARGMFEGTIDPRTGQPLQGGGTTPGGPGVAGMAAGSVPGAGGPVPSPGLGGVPALPGGQPGIPSTQSPGLGGVPAVGSPTIPQVGMPGGLPNGDLANQIIGQVNAGLNKNVLPGAGSPAVPGGQGPVPVQPGAAPGGTVPGTTGVRTAADILRGRLNSVGGTMPGAPAPSAAPTTGNAAAPVSAAPVPPGGAPPAAPSAAPVQPGSSGGIVDPTGPVQGAPQNNGVDWSQVNQYDDLFVKYGSMYGVDPNVLKKVMVVESGGVVPTNGHGVMQVQDNWQGTGGYDINTTEGQIAVAAMILGGQVQGGQPGNLEANFRNLYFNAPVEQNGNGTTQDGYWAWLASPMPGGTASAPLDKTAAPGQAPTGDGSIPLNTPQQPGVLGVSPGGGAPPTGAPANGTTPFPQIQATPSQAPNGKMVAQDPDYSWTNSIVAGSSDATLANNYGFDAASGCQGCYDKYQPSMWGDPNAHPGVDIIATKGSPITVPVSGKIICGGTDGSTVTPDGTGCNAFQQTDAFGNTLPCEGSGLCGEIEEQLGNGDLIIFGHALNSSVNPGDQVQAGQQIGQVGIGNGAAHTHFEVRHYDKQTGQWIIVDPTLYFSGYYGPVY